MEKEIVYGAALLHDLGRYRQYEEKNDAQRREKLISIQAKQQAAQLREIYENEQQLRLLRHDMRHFLGSLLAFLENGEVEKASQMIQSYSSLRIRRADIMCLWHNSCTYDNSLKKERHLPFLF